MSEMSDEHVRCSSRKFAVLRACSVTESDDTEDADIDADDDILVVILLVVMLVMLLVVIIIVPVVVAVVTIVSPTRDERCSSWSRRNERWW